MRTTIAALFCVLPLAVSTAWAGNTQSETINKQNVLAFYDSALNKKDFAQAKQYLGATYKQHNPVAQDGVAGFEKFIAFLKQKYPQSRSEITQSFVDGNYVILHVKNTGREPGETKAIIDIFKLDDNHKIIEHWDVTQTVPEKTASGNSMF